MYHKAVRLLVQTRKDAGVTQQVPATRLGQRQMFVPKFELGERRLDVAEYLKVSRALGTDQSANPLWLGFKPGRCRGSVALSGGL